eukprot:4166962-Prymnesium_polylepis.1
MPWDLFLPGVDGPLAFDHGHLARLLLAPNTISLINDPFSKRKLEGRQTFVGPGRQLALLMFGSAVAMHWYASLWWIVGERLESDGRASWLTSSPRVNDWQTWPFQARYARAFDHALAFAIGEGDGGDAHDEAYLALFGRLGGIVWLACMLQGLKPWLSNSTPAEPNDRCSDSCAADFTSTMVSICLLYTSPSPRDAHES